MNKDDALLLRGMLEMHQVLSLGVLVDGDPYVGLLPYAIREDWTAVIIHASRLARHSKGLLEGASFGIMIHDAESPDQDPLQIPRVSIQGHVHIVSSASVEYEENKARFMNRFPQSELTFGLGDFQLYLLGLEKGRFVAGFGKTLNLNSDHFKQLALLDR